MNTHAIKRRQLKKQIDILLSRLFVRVLVSKNEVFQEGKLSYEIAKNNELYDEQYVYNKKVNYYLRYMFNAGLFVIQ
ncbi:MAG: hypothetical protein H6765_02900 [Candidatus Peribacteria bacterium]|nr:MAG: hypothetical protein H6765_02900 [Candidatus Peribacteria bacterium]